MEIIIASQYDFFRARTNQLSDVRFAEGFLQNGHDVKIIAPYVYRKDNISYNKIHDNFGIDKKLKLKIFPTFFWDDMNKYISIPILMIVSFFILGWKMLKAFLLKKELVIISRSIDILYPLILLKKVINSEKTLLIFWAHDYLNKDRYNFIYKQSDLLIATNSTLAKKLSVTTGKELNEIIISLNPITEQQLRQKIDKKSARDLLDLDINQTYITYTGKLYKGQKEISYILDTALNLPQYMFIITGGKPHVIDFYKAKCKQEKINNIIFTGFLNDYTEVQTYQMASNILVSYYTTQDHQLEYNLPQKVCEYMLSNAVIITPNFGATIDVLNATNCHFVEAENSRSLTDGIEYIIKNKEYSNNLIQQMNLDIKGHTFKQRTHLIIEKIIKRVK